MRDVPPVMGNEETRLGQVFLELARQCGARHPGGRHSEQFGRHRDRRRRDGAGNRGHQRYGGGGSAPKTLRRVFDPFFHQRIRTGKSTGLGLSIAHGNRGVARREPHCLQHALGKGDDRSASELPAAPGLRADGKGLGRGFRRPPARRQASSWSTKIRTSPKRSPSRSRTTTRRTPTDQWGGRARLSHRTGRDL